jgi:hypothetical protein
MGIEQQSQGNDPLYELFSLTDYITQYGNTASLNDITLTTLYSYLKNPYKNIKEIRKASKYLANKHGVVKDVLKTIKTLPTLNHHLAWSSFDNPKQIKKYEQKIFDFIEKIDVKKFVRDGLYESGEVGTIVTCLRNNSYVQFLELDDLRITKQKNGKWIVEYDLQRIDEMLPKTGRAYQIDSIIESLPDDITKEKYLLYKNKGEDFRYVELSNCDVVAIDNNRNMPWGLPFTMGAWSSLIQKEIISRVERSMADRLIKQVLIMYAGNMSGTKESYKPVPQKLIEHYFKELSTLLQKKDQSNGTNSTAAETSGTGLVALPDFFNIKNLEIDNTMFTKDLYEKIDNDIYQNLGVSPALVHGGGSNFSSAQVNSEKLFRYIFSLLEQFETIINGYIKSLLPTNLSCRFYFERTTMLDRDKYIDKCKELYMQTGLIIPWLESLTGVSYQYSLGLAKYQKDVLKTEEYIFPPQNAFTQTENGKGGRPSDNSSGNNNTNKSKSSGGNSSPSPSD